MPSISMQHSGTTFHLKEATVPSSARILQIRTGKIKLLGSNGVKSAIFKEPQNGKVFVTQTGLVGDQQQYEHHGGIDKALHQYASSNYPLWRREKPDKAHLFEPGASGENLVADGLDESNVCIGDVFRLGEEVVAEVSEARMPCYKLSQRFEWPRMSKRAQKSGRVGWYFRILETGYVQEGDMMVLLKRPNPKWSIENAHNVFHDRNSDPALVRELSQLDALGKEIRDKAIGRLEGGGEVERNRLQGNGFDWLPYRLVEARQVTSRVKQMTFTYDEPGKKISHAGFGPYAYVRLRYGEKVTYSRSYSVVSGDGYKFTTGVALDDNSRGGSRYLHENLNVGDRIDVARGFSTNDEQQKQRLRAEAIERNIFIVGGIGITAFLREIQDMKARATPFEIHYAVRSTDDAPFQELLPTGKTHYYAKDRNDRLRVEEVIPKAAPNDGFNARIFCSGPKTLMEACEKRTQVLGYPAHMVHFESFGENRHGPLGEPFEVEVEDDGRTLSVPSEKTLLDVLNEAGFDVPSSCQVGKCGLCAVDLCAGKVEHKGTALPDDAKGTTMLSCVSRGKGGIKIQVE